MKGTLHAEVAVINYILWKPTQCLLDVVRFVQAIIMIQSYERIGRVLVIVYTYELKAQYPHFLINGKDLCLLMTSLMT